MNVHQFLLTSIDSETKYFWYKIQQRKRLINLYHKNELISKQIYQNYSKTLTSTLNRWTYLIIHSMYNVAIRTTFYIASTSGASAWWMHRNLIWTWAESLQFPSVLRLRPLWLGEAHPENCVDTLVNVPWVVRNVPQPHYNKQHTRPASCPGLMGVLVSADLWSKGKFRSA